MTMHRIWWDPAYVYSLPRVDAAEVLPPHDKRVVAIWRVDLVRERREKAVWKQVVFPSDAAACDFACSVGTRPGYILSPAEKNTI